MKAAYARRLVDDRNGGNDGFRKWDDFPAKQAGQPANCFVAAGRA
jgi:hypothetical protein